MILTLLFTGFVSWLTNWDFGAVWCAIAVVTTDLMFVLGKIYRDRLS